MRRIGMDAHCVQREVVFKGLRETVWMVSSPGSRPPNSWFQSKSPALTRQIEITPVLRSVERNSGNYGFSLEREEDQVPNPKTNNAVWPQTGEYQIECRGQDNPFQLPGNQVEKKAIPG